MASIAIILFVVFCCVAICLHKALLSYKAPVKVDVRNNVVSVDFERRGLLKECVSNLQQAKEIDKKLLLGSDNAEIEIMMNSYERDKLLKKALKVG